MIRSMFFSAIALVALCLAAPAPAATFCATSALELSTALNDAAGNGEDDVVRVQTGTYDGGGVHDFDYAPAEFQTGGDVGTSLILIGGYTPFFDNPCGQILIEDPFLTVLDGGDVRRALKLHVLEDSDVTVRLLTFMNGTPSDTSNDGGGLYFQDTGASNGTVTIERNAFIANEAGNGGGLYIYNATSKVRVINNLLFANSAGICAAGNIVKSDGPELFGDAVHIANNTVIGNDTPNPDSYGGLCVVAANNVGMHIYNNNLWDNQTYDLFLTGQGDIYLENNNFEVRGGEEPLSNILNISVEPVYQGGLFNFTPARTSPLVDAGKNGPQDDAGTWYLTDLDLRARTRLVGPKVDIGAYENERIFTNGFETPGPFDASRIETLCARLGCDAAVR